MNLTGGEDADPAHEELQTQLDIVPEEPGANNVESGFETDRLSRADTRLSSRVPSQMTRATLVRTPARPSTQEKFEEELTDEEQVLITELKQAEYREKDQQLSEDEEEELEQPVFKKEVITDKEDDYDTDLEPDEPIFDHDASGKSYYTRICEQFGIVPISYFLRHILDPEIVMRYHGLGPVAAKSIALVLRENVTLEKLNLNGNWIEGEGGEAMARMLEENDYITELHLADNRLGSTGAKSICRMLGTNAGLRKLDLADNGFEDGDAAVFDEMLQNNKYLKYLDLSRNRFGELAGEILGPAIAANDILETLDLSWNHLRQKGAIAVARGLKENVRLKKCSLAWNGFGPEGGAAIADALMTNSALQEIDISGNRLNADVAVKLAKAISINDSIKILKMGNNLITTSGAIALARAVNETESGEMELLDLTDIPVEYEFLRICEEIGRKKPGFKVLYGPVLRSGNTSEDLGKKAIDPFKKKDPVIVLDEHIVVNDLRLVDILRRHDPDETLCVTPEEFLASLDELALPYDKVKVEEAVRRIADEQSGRIYFGDFLKQQEEAAKAFSEQQQQAT